MSDPFADYHDRAASKGVATAWSSAAASGMVASAHYLASAIGRDILASGGNAIDAAVAAALALSVCEPGESGLGGMAMATVFDAATGRTRVIEGQCRAPAAADAAVVKHLDRKRGYGVVAVPPALAVLDLLLDAHGTLAADVVLQPAIELAAVGFPVTPHQANLARRYRPQLRAGNAAAAFLEPDGALRPVGAMVVQPSLARTLQRLARAGLRDFYEGEIAAQIDADMRASGGFVRLGDLAACQPGILAPLEVDWASPEFGACTLRLPGPPAGGITLAQMMLLDGALTGSYGAARTPTGDCPVRLAAIIRQSRADRRRTAMDVEARQSGGAAGLLTTAYAAAIARQLRAELEGGGNTSHLSVIDAAGNAVAITLSLNRCFGAAVATPALGFLYNGYLRAFKVESVDHPHFLRPGAIARSNSVPTIVFRDGRPCIVIGSSGSERIQSAVFQVLTALGRGVSPFAAVHAPRLHATPESVIRLEATRFDTTVGPALRSAGFTLRDVGPYAFFVGAVQLVVRTSAGQFIGAADPRRDGAAFGPGEPGEPGGGAAVATDRRT